MRYREVLKETLLALAVSIAVSAAIVGIMMLVIG